MVVSVSPPEYKSAARGTKREALARALIPLFLFSLTGAALVLPDQREMLKRLSEILSTPAERGLVAWIAVRTVRSLRSTGRPGTSRWTRSRSCVRA